MEPDDNDTPKAEQNSEDNGKSEFAKGMLPTDQANEDAPRIRTVTPDNENGDPGPPKK